MTGWLKTREARRYCSMSEKTFERIVASGLLSFVRLPSGHRRFNTGDLDEYMRQFQVGGTASPVAKAEADRILARG